ncbi:ribosomal protein S18-alanine N-acetyltransferase [Pasteurellaceae bacterium 22721_9_1]
MSESLQIIPLEESDFEQIFAIEQAAHEVPWSIGTLKNNQGERYHNLKVLLDEKIVGFAICQVVLDEATLFNIAIDPKYQGRKFGAKLLLALIEQLKQRGIATLWLEVRESNQKAIALYDSCQFNQVDIRKNYYPTKEGKRENAIVMAAYLF